MLERKSYERRSWVLGSLLVMGATACNGYLGTTDGRASSSGDPGAISPAGSSTPGSSEATNPTESGPRDPGRVTIRRLNRVEYDNTVRDLLGTTQTLGQSTFLNDAPQLGFDNDADLQTLSPVQFTRYEQAAEALAAEVMNNAVQRGQLVSCDLQSGTACVTKVIATVGKRAFRRPLASDEVAAFQNLMTAAAQAGASADEQFQTVLEAMLVSPHFLFRPELDPDPAGTTPHLLAPYEVASRLSYAVYRSMPDQELFDAAEAGKLAEPAELRAQLERMLASPKNAFGTTFPAQWLGTSGIATESFDADLFPKFNPSLAASMAGEVTSFFGELLQKNGPVSDLLTAKYSYIDAGLAGLYGIPVPAGSGLVRTTLSTSERGGLLTMAGVLSVTSYPTRTSLVRRGAFVLSQLLCAPPPAPPPDIPAFPEGEITATTQRGILAQHRAIKACAACHDSMDNIGAAMENYDALGAYRTQDAGQTIDASGSFTGAIAQPSGGVGPTFNGAIELAAAVAADPRFAPCIAQNVLSYALGRSVRPADQPYLQDISKPSSGSALGVRDILLNVIASDPFRMRHGDPTPAPGGML